MAEFREDVRDVLSEILGGEPDVEARKMFGFPAFFAGRKMAACLYEGGVGLRLTPEAAEQVAGESLPAFTPMGKPMRGWVMLERDRAEDLREDAPLLHAALDTARAVA
jgi:hypothetical protein